MLITLGTDIESRHTVVAKCPQAHVVHSCMPVQRIRRSTNSALSLPTNSRADWAVKFVQIVQTAISHTRCFSNWACFQEGGPGPNDSDAQVLLFLSWSATRRLIQRRIRYPGRESRLDECGEWSPGSRLKLSLRVCA